MKYAFLITIEHPDFKSKESAAEKMVEILDRGEWDHKGLTLEIKVPVEVEVPNDSK